jgi:hypothetical protein
VPLLKAWNPAWQSTCGNFGATVSEITNQYVPMDSMCIRDGDVAGALEECLGAYCDSLQPAIIGPLGGTAYLDTTYVQKAIENLSAADMLCSNAPCVTGGGPNCPVMCLTLTIYPCH